MVLKAYAVFDSKMAVFGRPVFFISDGAAIREFSDQVNSDVPNNSWYNHPEDFSLFFIGEYDDEKGQLKSQIPVNLISASSLKGLSLKKEVD